MQDKLIKIIKKHEELSQQLGDPTIINDISLYKKISQEYSGLKETVEIAEIYISKNKELDEVNSLISQETD